MSAASRICLIREAGDPTGAADDLKPDLLPGSADEAAEESLEPWSLEGSRLEGLRRLLLLLPGAPDESKALSETLCLEFLRPPVAFLLPPIEAPEAGPDERTAAESPPGGAL